MSNGEANCVVINLVLHHLAVPLDGIKEARRVLKKHGRLIVTDFDKHEDETLRGQYGDRWLGFEKEEMESWLKSVNFKLERFVQLEVSRGLSINLYEAQRK